MKRLPAALRVALLALLAALAAGEARAGPDAGPAPGPPFGANAYRTEIGPWPGDRDDYAAGLVAGERLAVSVAAAPGSALVPEIALLDPDGVARALPLVRAASGRRVASRPYVIDRTGTWTVRVSGADDTRGRYTVAFRLRGPPGVAALRAELGAAAGVLEREHPFEAVGGCDVTLVLRARGAGGVPVVAAVADPHGDPVPLPSPRRRGRTTLLRRIPLAGADGTWRVSVAVEEGDAAYDLSIRVRPPRRPRGTIELSPDEPRLAAVAAPIRGGSARVVRLGGVNFSPGARPDVWFGDRRALVVAVAPHGIWIDASPPIQPLGTVSDVTVVNPDGQAARAPSYFEYVEPPPPALSRFVPGTTSAYVATTLRMTLALRAPAPFGGVAVELSTEGGVGTVPPVVSVGAGESSVRFDLAASHEPAEGRIVATLGDGTVAAAVSVVPLPEPDPGGEPGPPPPLPDFLELSGWTLTQANSARTFTFPVGTLLRQGDLVVVGRAATRDAFEAYWGVTLGDEVRYFTNDPTNTSTASDDWPSINGDESFTLRDAEGVVVDGPTTAMQPGGGANYSRKPGTDAGQTESWDVSVSISPGGAPTPGTGPPPSAVKHGVYVSEFSDVVGGNNRWVYEFVELHFDGNP